MSHLYEAVLMNFRSCFEATIAKLTIYYCILCLYNILSYMLCLCYIIFYYDLLFCCTNSEFQMFFFSTPSVFFTGIMNRQIVLI